jgi:5-methylcytosine-specific restriction endonuclease McrA
MNYSKIHDQIIEIARNRIVEGSTERHHIIPRSLGGTDDVSNLVDLTFKEHYIVHILLTKMYPESKELLHAAWMMSNRLSAINGRTYSIMRQRYVDLLKSKHQENPEYYKTMAYMNKGVKKSSTENYKKPKSLETRTRMAEAALQRPKVSCEVCGRIVTKRNLTNHMKAHTGEIKHDDEKKSKISAGVKRIPRVSCTICNETINPGNMWRHMRKHERQKNDLQCF